MAGDPHGPNRLTNYSEIHDKVMRRFIAENFVLSDGTAIEPYPPGFFILQGRIECIGGIRLDVWKVLARVDGEGAAIRVQNVAYCYNAVLQGLGNILRYDSPHLDGHNEFHHVHRYNILRGDTDGTLERSNWPHLGDVIEELRNWYYDHFEEIEKLQGR